MCLLNKSTNGCSMEEFALYFITFIKQHTSEFTKENVVLCSTPKKTSAQMHKGNTNHYSSSRHELLENSSLVNGLSQNAFDELGCVRLNSDTPIKNTFHPMNTSSPQLRTPTQQHNNSYSLRSFDASDTSTSFAAAASKSNDHKKSTSSPLCLSDFLNAVSSTSSPSPRITKSRKVTSTPAKDFPAPTGNQQNTKHTNKCTDDVSPHVKQKKRVAPIKLASTTNPHEFNSFAFQMDNNLIGIEHRDDLRDALKSQSNSISTDLFPNKNADLALRENLQHKLDPTDNTIDLTKISCKNELHKLIDTYSALIDFNLTTNVLAELSYLLNLLNADYDLHPEAAVATLDHDAPAEKRVAHVLKSGHNCVYLSIGVLKRQKHCLIMLDLPTIKILVENVRIQKYDNDLDAFLQTAYAQKQRTELDIWQKKSLAHNNCVNLNVSYQQENDTKDNFPSIREFTAFNKQRDMFYNILRIWESKHFIPSWSFLTELGPKIRNLLGLMNHPINMSHLAKLFTSQLMLSCNFHDSMPELQEALPKADISKISKLHQRLTAPSSFSTNYLFPGLQAFFKEFLVSAEHNSIFVEQLKTALINELIDMNNSTYDTINLSRDSDMIGNQNFTEYVVLPENINKMRVLAKFIGFVQARPYAYEGFRNPDVDNRQIHLRNMIVQPFDVKDLLEKSIAGHKLLVLLPWLVQYLSMLDFVTLRLDYYLGVLKMLYEVYILASECKLQMRSSSLFVVRLCLGWLFDQPNSPDTYFEYRMCRSRKPLPPPSQVVQHTEHLKQAVVFIPNTIAKHFSSDKAKISSYTPTSPGQLQCTIEFDEQFPTEPYSYSASSSKNLLSAIDPIMESILTSSCPFLADFRVSIMPTRHLKTVSRTGRFRHVTTKMSEAVGLVQTQRPAEIDDQTKLAEAFLHSQSLSLRRTVEFVIERTVSAVIKDYQVQVLLPVKKQATAEVNALVRSNKDTLLRQMNVCFAKAKQNLLLQWSDLMPKWIQMRVKKAFSALLPNETSAAVKRTCINLVVQKCTVKTTDWLATNLHGLDIFSKDIPGDAEKLLKVPAANEQRLVNGFTLTQSTCCPSNVFGRLQMELHKASLKPETLQHKSVVALTDHLQLMMCEHSLPFVMYKTTGFMTLQLVLLIVCARSDLITTDLIHKFTTLWKNTPIVCHTKSSETSEDDSSPPDDCRTRNNTISMSNNIFQDIISSQYLARLSSSPSNAIDGMKMVLTELLNAKCISASELNDQCVYLFREELPEDVLAKLSKLLRDLLESVNEGSDKDSFMFMEMMSELSGDMNNY